LYCCTPKEWFRARMAAWIFGSENSPPVSVLKRESARFAPRSSWQVRTEFTSTT
jgi:hypothetical protein